MAMFGAFNTFGKLGSPAGGRSLTLAQQIAAMSPSLWLEPSVTNGYQDSAGTTALTQPGAGSADPPVGLALDLSGNGRNASQSTSTARPKLSARVNLLRHTENFSNSNWTKSGVTLTNNNAVAPDGTTTASTISFPSGGGASQFFQPNMVSGASARQSVYLRLVSGFGAGFHFGAYDGGGTGGGSSNITLTSAWQRFELQIPAFTGSDRRAIWMYPDAVATIEIWHPQLELGSTATAYQRVTDANNYAYAGWPLIHVYDTVDDVMNVTFPSSLGSDCTVVTANLGTTPTILTGQTIGTSYTITATNAGRLVFPRALTAAETAIVTAWATQKGALPS